LVKLEDQPIEKSDQKIKTQFLNKLFSTANISTVNGKEKEEFIFQGSKTFNR